MNELRMGYGEADITPDAPARMIGFGSSGLSQGVAAPLMAQVALWQQGNTRCCLAAIDHIGFATEHALKLRNELARLLHIQTEHVMLCFSHTHSAPNDSIEREYSEWLDGRVLAAARAARDDMRPVRTAWGVGSVDIGVNRRAQSGALDRRVGVLKVADAHTGELRLVLLRLTAHCNSLKSDNKLISPDWFGAARAELGACWGCQVMLTQGAAGNVAPRFFRSRIDPPDADDVSGRYVRTEDALHEMAQAVRRGVEPVLSSIQPRDAERLSMWSAHGELTSLVPDMERARAIAAEALREAGIDGTAWLAEVERLCSAGIKEQCEAVEIQYFRLDEGCLIGVPNELMCEIALEAAGRMGEYAFMGGYTNGCTGYMPTAAEYDRGGYEVLWSMLHYFMYFGRVMPLKRDSADRLVDMAVAGMRA